VLLQTSNRPSKSNPPMITVCADEWVNLRIAERLVVRQMMINNDK